MQNTVTRYRVLPQPQGRLPAKSGEKPKGKGVPLKPILVHRGASRPRRHLKLHVHWHKDAMDNEHKMRSRAKRSSTTRTATRGPSSPMAPPKLASLMYPANTSVKMSTPSSKQQLTQVPMKAIMPVPQPFRPGSEISTRPRTQLPATTANTSSRITHPVAMTTRPQATRSRGIYHVPDPPRTPKTPPAPRPRRLSTPDLPEVDESKFFAPLPSRVPTETVRGRPMYMKADAQSKGLTQILDHS